MKARAAALLLRAGVAALALACAGLERAPSPALVGRIRDVEAGSFVPEDAFFARLAGARYVLLGEMHDNPQQHRLQARAITGLVAAGRRPAVVFEMIGADAAPALAEATARPGATADDVRRAVDWDTSGWPDFALYAPIFEAALAAGLPLAAGGLSREELTALRQGGLPALEPATRARLGLDAPVPAAQSTALAEDIRAGHCGYAPERILPRMLEVQRARDARLARALVDAGGSDGAVLIAGAGHVRRDWAVPYWLGRLDPGAPLLALSFVEVVAEHAASEPPAPYDLVWYTESVEREDPCRHFREPLQRLNEAP